MPTSGARSRTSSSTSSDKPNKDLGQLRALVVLQEVTCIPDDHVFLPLGPGH
jgi:hypothetical protein